MTHIIAFFALWAALMGTASGQDSQTVSKVMIKGQTLQVANYQALDAGCQPIGRTFVRVVEKPQHGRIIVRPVLSYSEFGKDNSRHKCNARKTPSTAVLYQPARRFTGTDSFKIEVVFADGDAWVRAFDITVKPLQDQPEAQH